MERAMRTYCQGSQSLMQMNRKPPWAKRNNITGFIMIFFRCRLLPFRASVLQAKRVKINRTITLWNIFASLLSGAKSSTDFCSRWGLRANVYVWCRLSGRQIGIQGPAYPIKYASCLRIEFRMNHPTMCASEQVQKRKLMSAALISAKDRVTNFIPRRLAHVMPTTLFQH